MTLDNDGSRKIFRSLYIIYTVFLLYVLTTFYNDPFLDLIWSFSNHMTIYLLVTKFLLKWVSRPFHFLDALWNVRDILLQDKNIQLRVLMNWLYKISNRFILNYKNIPKSVLPIFNYKTFISNSSIKRHFEIHAI